MEGSGRTLVCSVLFLDIAEYTKKPVAEQLQLKQAFNQALGATLQQVAQRDRIILDTGDGAAVTFLGDPEDALFASIAMRDNVVSLSVRLGVNLGPVRLVKDLNGQVNIIGDGINVAQRVMSFAQPGQLLVSRSFFEVVSCLSRDYVSLFHHEGSRTDKHVRDHDVYSVVGGTPATRRFADTDPQATTGARASTWLRGVGPFGLRRSSLIAAPFAFVLVVAGGVAARAMMEPPASAIEAPAKLAAAPAKPADTPAPAKLASPAAPAKPADTPAPKAAAAPDKPQPVPKKLIASLEKKLEKGAAAAPSTRLELAVAPWGEVLVDGKSRGVSPPLRVLKVPPGPHTIEIRNSTFPPYVEKVQVKEGEAVKIRHRFK
jgi:class 3 adenylate cyclase